MRTAASQWQPAADNRPHLKVDSCASGHQMVSGASLRHPPAYDRQMYGGCNLGASLLPDTASKRISPSAMAHQTQHGFIYSPVQDVMAMRCNLASW